MNYRTGKRPARPGAISFRFAAFAKMSALPRVPDVFGHSLSIGRRAWGMLGNDIVGNCVFAGGAHETMLLGKEAGQTIPFNATDVVSDYSAVTGYDPSRPDTDLGADVQEAAAYRRRVGLLDASGKRRRVEAYLALDPGNIPHLFAATYLFGAVGIGLRLPEDAMSQFDEGRMWSVSGAPGDGHYVPLVAHRPGVLRVITWGVRQEATDEFLKKYCDEAVVYVSRDGLVNERSPEGFRYDELIEQLGALA